MRHRIRVTHANEALSDPKRVRLNPDPASASGRSIRTIGWSPSLNQVLTVLTLPNDEIEYGLNAWVSNATDQKKYRESR
ncbi:MAG: hypothetical protein ACOYBP_00730 [Microbacteriaceae bacterium]